MYNECLCLGCKNRSNDNIKVTDIVNDNYNIDQGTCFEDIKDSTDEKNDVNNNVKVNDNVNDNNNVIVSDNVNDNVNVNTNDSQGTCFAEDNANANDNQGACSADDNNNDNKNNNDSDKDVDVDSFIYLFGEKHPRVKHIREAVWEQVQKPLSPITHSSWGNKEFIPYSNNISINVNGSLQSWLADDNINFNAIIPENFRCIISGPSECGKTFLLKKLVMIIIQFDNLYIIGPTGDQYNDTKHENIEFIKDIKKLVPLHQLPKDIKKLMIFDDVRAKEPLKTFVEVDIIIVL